MPYSVLIVDDEALTLRTLGRALGDEGFEVFLAMSGEEALPIFADEKPDFALLDVVLPAMNGIEVLRQAKVSSPATIILMMSAYHLVDRAVEAMKLGAYDYLIKPFHVADMVNTLRRAAEMLLPQLPTPRRIALVDAAMSLDLADFRKQGVAINTFYARLTPNQQKTFDQRTLPPTGGAGPQPQPQPQR